MVAPTGGTLRCRLADVHEIVPAEHLVDLHPVGLMRRAWAIARPQIDPPCRQRQAWISDEAAHSEATPLTTVTCRREANVAS